MMEHVEVDTLTDDEFAWLALLRLIGRGRAPAPTIRHVRLLRRLCDLRRA